jgi:hypothetical protein
MHKKFQDKLHGFFKGKIMSKNDKRSCVQLKNNKIVKNSQMELPLKKPKT